MTLNKTQRRMLGALLMLSGNDMKVHATMQQLAVAAGYQKPGGIMTYALEILERENKIAKVGDGEWLITL